MDSTVFDLARQIARKQGVLGSSPAERLDNGVTALCAASCVAEAALLSKNDLEGLKDFRERLWTDDKVVLVSRFFEQCGLSSGMAAKLMKENDRRRPAERIEWFESSAWYLASTCGGSEM